MLSLIESNLKSNDDEVKFKTFKLLIKSPKNNNNYISKFLVGLSVDEVIKYDYKHHSNNDSIIITRNLLLNLYYDYNLVKDYNKLLSHLILNKISEDDKYTIKLIKVILNHLIKFDNDGFFNTFFKYLLSTLKRSNDIREFNLNSLQILLETKKNDDRILPLSNWIFENSLSAIINQNERNHKLLKLYYVSLTIGNHENRYELSKLLLKERLQNKFNDSLIDCQIVNIHSIENPVHIDETLAIWFKLNEVNNSKHLDECLMNIIHNNNNTIIIFDLIQNHLNYNIDNNKPIYKSTFDALKLVIKHSKDGKLLRSRLSSILIQFINILNNDNNTDGIIYLQHLIEIIEIIVVEKAIILQSNDVSNILLILSLVLSPTEISPMRSSKIIGNVNQIMNSIISTMLHLIKLRRDICSLNLSSLTYLISRLIECFLTLGENLGTVAKKRYDNFMPVFIKVEKNMNETESLNNCQYLSRMIETLDVKTVPLTISNNYGNKGNVAASLKDNISRHAFIILLTYARSAISANFILSSKIRNCLKGGLFTIFDFVDGVHSSDFVLNSLNDHDGSSFILKSLYHEWKSQKYIGMS